MEDQSTAEAPDRPQLAKAWELYGKSAELVRNNLSVFGLLYIVPIVYSLLGAFGGHNSSVHGTWGWNTQTPGGLSWITWIGIGGIVFLLFTLVILIVTMLTQAAALQAAQTKTASLNTALASIKRVFWRLLGVYILSGIIIVIGFILLIVPGVIMLRRYYLAPYVMLDQKLGVWDAMERSAAMSKPYSGSIYRIIGLSILLALPGGMFSAFGLPLVGSLISLVLAFFFIVVPPLRYEELKPFYKSLPLKPTADKAAQNSASSQTESSA